MRMLRRRDCLGDRFQSAFFSKKERLLSLYIPGLKEVNKAGGGCTTLP